MWSLHCYLIILVITVTVLEGALIANVRGNNRRLKRKLFNLSGFDCKEHLCNTTNIEYPFEYIAQATNKLRHHPLLEQYSGTVVQTYSDDVMLRGFLPQESNMCKTRVYTIQPVIGRNINFENKFIVQAPDYKQVLEVERCEREGASCNEYMPNNYVTFCKSRKFTVKLLSMDSSGNFKAELFPIAVGCACNYRVTHGSLFDM